MRRIVAVMCALGFTAVLAPAAAQAGGHGGGHGNGHGHGGHHGHGHGHGHHHKPKTTHLQVLSINDFHGNLEPPGGSSGALPGVTGPVGGAAYLSTWMTRLREAQKHTVTVGAGDLIGASPLISGLFHDEPTIEAMNAMGLKISSVGNHEFDEGIDELLRMQNGGCHPVDGCQDGDPFTGAAFQYLAANVRYADTNRTVLPPYEIYKAGKGVRVGFIGLTLEGTPLIVTPSGVAGLQFDDEIQTVNKYAKQLKKRGVNAIFVLIHQGGQQNPPYATGTQNVNGCENFTGDIQPIVEGLSKDVDVVASAHTHQPYNCRIGGKLVTSASSFGRLITDFDLTLNRKSGDVVYANAQNVPVTRDVTPDPAIQAIIDKYNKIAGPIRDRVVGQITAPITDDPAPNGESALGDVIADAQLAATAPADFGAAKIAFMNPGGIRADLTPAGDVTYGQLYATQPFANTMVVKTMTGQMIKDLLEQQFDNPAAGSIRILQISAGFTYSYNPAAAAGSHVDPASIKLDGTTIAPTDSVRVAMNNFLSTGGDGFTVFNQGTDQLGGPVDIDALADYFMSNSPVAPGPQDRITVTG